MKSFTITFKHSTKLLNRSEVNKVLDFEPSDKTLSTLLKEVLANIKMFDQTKLFELMDTRKHAYRA